MPNTSNRCYDSKHNCCYDSRHNCCYGSRHNPKWAQAQYARLITSLVSPEAIAQGIVTPKNVTLVLFFFMRVGQNSTAAPWLMPTPDVLKESRWLQVVNWLMGQCILLEGRKSRITDYLVAMDEMACSTNGRSMQQIMVRPLSPDIAKVLAHELAEASKSC